MARVYYVSSYFWDRALESGIINDKKAIAWKTSPAVRMMRGIRGQDEAKQLGPGCESKHVRGCSLACGH